MVLQDDDARLIVILCTMSIWNVWHKLCSLDPCTEQKVIERLASSSTLADLLGCFLQCSLLSQKSWVRFLWMKTHGKVLNSRWLGLPWNGKSWYSHWIVICKQDHTVWNWNRKILWALQMFRFPYGCTYHLWNLENSCQPLVPMGRMDWVAFP